jgi:hypothetical protein
VANAVRDHIGIELCIAMSCSIMCRAHSSGYADVEPLATSLNLCVKIRITSLCGSDSMVGSCEGWKRA